MKPRYVGGTVQALEKRLYQHIWSSKTNKSNIHIREWIKSLLAEGITPIIELLCICDGPSYKADEKAWIAFCRMNGCDLLNVSDGGEWCPVGRVVSQITRERMSNAARGRKHSKEVKEKMSKDRKGTPLPAGATEAARKVNLGKKRPHEVVERIRLSNKGRKHTPEQIEKNRLINLGKKFSEEHKANISKGLTGKKRAPFTDEHRKNLSESHKGQVAWNKGKITLVEA